MVMRMWFALLVIPAGFAQTERAFQFTKITDAQQMADVSKAIAAVGGFAAPAVDAEKRTLTAVGTAAQLTYAEWALAQLDVDPLAHPVHAVIGDHLLGGDPKDLVRIFRIANAANIQQFQEIGTIIRSLTEVKYLYSSWPTGSILVRGDSARLDLGQWIVERLDHPVAEIDYNRHDYDLPAPLPGSRPGENLTRITAFRVANSTSTTEFLEIVTALRSIGEFRYVMSHGASGSFFIRSTAADADVASWLLQQVDRKTGGAVAEYRYPAVDDVINVIYVPSSNTVAQFQQEVTRIRGATNLRRVFTLSRLRAVLVRDSEARVAEARKMFTELVAAK